MKPSVVFMSMPCCDRIDVDHSPKAENSSEVEPCNLTAATPFFFLGGAGVPRKASSIESLMGTTCPLTYLFNVKGICQ